MRTKRSLVWAAAGVTAVAFAGGCAARQMQRLQPKLELRAAAQGLAEERRVGLTFSMTGSADDLVAALQPSASDVAILRKLVNSSVTVAYDRAGEGVDDDRMLASATIDGVEGAEIRVVDGTLYAKAPVTDLVTELDLGDVGAARAEAVGAVPALGAFFDGRWVAVDVAEAAGLGELSTGRPMSATDARRALAELETSASNLFGGADVTRDPADPRHLVVTTSAAAAYGEMKRLVTAMDPDLGDQIGDAPPDRPVVLDVWADNGKLSAVELNILQFADGAAGRVAVRAEVIPGAPIDAPSDATTIDVSALAGLVGPTPGGFSSGTGVTDPQAPSGAAGDPGAGDLASETAAILGVKAKAFAAADHGDPADHLTRLVAEMGSVARIVRNGVAEVTVDGRSACLTVPASSSEEPTVRPGPC